MNVLNHKDTYLIAIGNNGRQDDGLGWAFAEAVEKQGLFQGQISFKYQLNVEDAEMITQSNRVLFVDACYDNLEKGFSYIPCEAAVQFEFSTHALNPESIIYLCNSLYNWYPQSHILKIQGYEWELQMGLSTKAKENLVRAIEFFTQLYTPD